MAKSVARRHGRGKARGTGGERLVARAGAPAGRQGGSGFHQAAKYGKGDRREGRRAVREQAL